MTKRNKKKRNEQKEEASLNQPWISMRSGLKIIAINSVAMVVLTAWQVIPSKS